MKMNLWHEGREYHPMWMSIWVTTSPTLFIIAMFQGGP